NRSHWSTSKTPSYTKSVSWQHHLAAESMNNNALTGYFIAPCQKSYILSRFLLSHTG
ncbi:transposase, partial [Cronobacter sakazakii]